MYRRRALYAKGYERNLKSTAYVPYSKGKVYVQGSLNGGESKDYIEMYQRLMKNIDADLEQRALSRIRTTNRHLNYYIIGRDDVRLLEPSFAFPGDRLDASMPYPQIITMVDKSRYFNVRQFKNAQAESKARRFIRRVRKYLFYNTMSCQRLLAAQGYTAASHGRHHGLWGLGATRCTSTCFTKALALRGNDVRLSLLYFDIAKKRSKVVQTTKFLLDQIFGLEIRLASDSDVKRLGRPSTCFLNRVLRRLSITKKTHYIWRGNGVRSLYWPEILSVHEGLLDGFWTSFRYAQGIEDTLRKDFAFRLPLDERNQKLAEQLQAEESVSVHVRRSEYLSMDDLYVTLDADYYRNAIAYFEGKLDKPVFYVFSDDIEWCEDNLHTERMVFVDWNEGVDVYYKKMQLMSLCKHNIVANSSFSMWGAWLNPNPAKIVVRPSRYYVDKKHCEADLWPDEWITL